MDELSVSSLERDNVVRICAGKNTRMNRYDFYVLQGGILPVCDLYHWHQETPTTPVGPMRVVLLGSGEDTEMQYLSLREQARRVEQRELCDARPPANGLLRVGRSIILLGVRGTHPENQRAWHEVLPLVEGIAVDTAGERPVVIPSWLSDTELASNNHSRAALAAVVAR